MTRAGQSTRKLRVAYLTSEYPKASHTFVRRELQELERRGHYVVRTAIRNAGAASVSAEDQAEEPKTFHIVSQPKAKVLAAIARVELTRPGKWAKAVEMAANMAKVGSKGLATHMAYVAEAAVLLEHLEREKIDHLHVHFGNNAATVARLVRALGGPPYSMTIHGPDEFDQVIGFSIGAKVVDASFVVAITDFCAAQLKRWAPYEHWSKIHIVHCAIGNDFFAEDRPIHEGNKKLLCIGRLSPAKAQLLLVDAVKRLVDEGHPIELVLAGDGEMRQIIEGKIREHHLEGRVTITGWIDEATVRKHLAECRVLVQPSFAEGLPVVLMEAMAMGRPVISTMIAGIPELVRHHENGWLITSGNIDDLTDAMREAITRPVAELNVMGQAGKARVRERHYMSTEVDKLEDLLLRYVP